MRNPTIRLLFLFILSILGGCTNGHIPETGTSTVTEMEQAETNHQRLARRIPPPQLQDSQERRNLVRRLELVNNANRISYIHLLAMDGRVIFYSTVRGKVSSLNSMLTTSQQVVTIPYPGCAGGGGTSCYNQNVIESPDFDGTYGDNPRGIFWFTPDGTYMEWNGNYFISDRPMRLSQEPTMVMQVNGQGNPVTPSTTTAPAGGTR
jgi:hypothetical protein